MLVYYEDTYIYPLYSWVMTDTKYNIVMDFIILILITFSQIIVNKKDNNERVVLVQV